jgi:hypothetical protein
MMVVERTNDALIYKRPPGIDDKTWKEIGQAIYEATEFGMRLKLFADVAERLAGLKGKCLAHPNGECGDNHAPPKTRTGETVN